MANEFENSPLEVRIPVRYFDMLMDGEITGSMLLTTQIMHRLRPELTSEAAP
jgi:hypothetical protein